MRTVKRTTLPANVEWRAVACDPLFCITADGRLFRWGDRQGPVDHAVENWKQIRGTPTVKGGYIQVRVGGKLRRLHVLVLEAFVGPCPPGMETRHLDNNRKNNRLDNICWGTPKQNGEDRVANGTSNKGSTHGMSVLTEDDVLAIRKMVKDGISRREAARRSGVSRSVVDRIINGKGWTHVP